MADQWEYKGVPVAWLEDEKKWQASMPGGQSSKDISIGALLSAWGEAGWELTNVAVERYRATDVSGHGMVGYMANEHFASSYRAFFKRRKS